MIDWWHQLPIWQRIAILGLALLLYVLGMHSIIWSPLDQRIKGLRIEMARLEQESQGHIQKIVLLKELEAEISELRTTLEIKVKKLPEIIKPQTFRREVVGLGMQKGVTVRLWKPDQALTGFQLSDSSLSIAVKVEGPFHRTAQFLDELLQVSWVQSLESMVIVRNQKDHESSSITTDITLRGFTPLGIQQVKELLET